ncbi:PREDICTED: odorant receptor 30a-like [Papilio polytes]|uniref:odorant receptor 30a-like n=1 Tax=Papilio polytes TaxID=76194 RepID=UPI0006765E09|nr:PREDICTED: odorant receptor 30a-like [Papilio polytes]WCC57646.1 odorant receptor 56 [Papilio polytes]
MEFAGIFSRGQDFFDINLKYLFYVGLWPREDFTRNKAFLYKLYEIVLHILSLVYVVTTSIGTYQNKHDVAIFLSNLDKSLVAYNFVLKVIIFVIKRKHVEKLIKEIAASGDRISYNQKRLMALHVIIITIVATAIIGAFSLLALFKMEMIVEAWMPFDPHKNVKNYFMATQILVITFIVPCSYRSIAMQGIVCSIVMYLCEQFIDLQNKIKRLEYSREIESCMRTEFKEIVKKHVRLMRFSKQLSTTFKEFFLIQNLAVSVEMCLNAMMVTMVEREQKTLLASFIAFLTIALINAYIYCYLGNEMIVQSEGIAMAAYEASWTSWPLDMQKDLLIVIRVAQKPLSLSAGGVVTMSMQAYSQALYNGYSIFAVLNDAVD